MSTREAIDVLREGRRNGYGALVIGGGEPTLRKDLFAIVAAARELGYVRIRLQTNGMLLGYAEYARRCFEAGISEVTVSIKGADAATHDRLSATPGSFALVEAGVGHWAALRRPVEAEVLVYRSNVDQLAAIARHFQPLGVERFRFQLFEAPYDAPAETTAEVPRVEAVVANVAKAMDLKLVDAYGFIQSPGTPPCTVPASHANCLVVKSDPQLIVAPGGTRLPLASRSSEGGRFTHRCGPCAMRTRCRGFQGGYVRVHGDEAFQPLSSPRLPGIEAPLKLLDRPEDATRA